MDNVIAEMETMAAKFKRNSKLNQEDSKRAKELLLQLLTRADLRKSGIGYMMSLPTQVGCSAFVDAWKQVGEPDRTQLVEGITDNKDFAGLAGFNRIVEIISLFLPISIPVAANLLVVLTEKSTSGASKKPHPAIVKAFRVNLMEDTGIIKVHLGKQDLNPRQVTAI